LKQTCAAKNRREDSPRAVVENPFMLVLGDREMEERKVAVRERKGGDIGAMTLDEFKATARNLIETRA
jgi:threonyl-tRNA synthetase